MNKALLTAISISALLISLIVTAYPHPVRADSTDALRFLDSGVTIYSPVNMTYYYGNLFLNISLYSAGSLGGLDPEISMNYSIDGIYNGSVPLRSNGEIHVVTVAVGTIGLPSLPNGSHYLTIYLYGFNQRTYEPRFLSYANTVYFGAIGNPALAPTASPNSTATPSPAPSTTSQNPDTLVSSNPNSTASITINSTMYAFDGSELLWSFNATAKSRVELNLTLTGDNSFETIFKVESSNHGTIFNSTLYGNIGLSNFTQAVNLNYDDAYNITVGKHPFYSTVKIKGTIDLYLKNTINSTPTPTYFPSLTPTYSPSNSPTKQPTMQPIQILDNNQESISASTIIIISIIIIVTMVLLFSFTRRKGLA
jgi:hypothetical protein